MCITQYIGLYHVLSWTAEVDLQALYPCSFVEYVRFIWLVPLRLFEYAMHLTHVTLYAGCLRGEGNDCTESCIAAAFCML